MTVRPPFGPFLASLFQPFARLASLAALPHRVAVSGAVVAFTLGITGCGGDDSGSDSSSDPAATDGRPTARVAAVPSGMATPGQAKWGDVIGLPLVPASAANLPDGRLLFWSANDRFFFSYVGQAYTAIFDPISGQITEKFVNETGQNMFCPGTTNLADGRLLVSGGSQAPRTSLYDPATSNWSVGAQMNIQRAYQANTLLRDGSVLTLGGSWADSAGNKHGEIWTQAGGWKKLPGLLVEPFLTADPRGVFRSDNHMWLIPAGNGQVFHAGPSRNMNWIDTTGNGSSRPAGTRGDDDHSMSGNAVMYDTGKILKVGGSPAYENSQATANSYVIDIQAGVKVRKVASSAYARAFHNSVVLPNGQVVVIGGQSNPVTGSDGMSVLAPELWDPDTETFTTLAPISVPRNYHSVALLMPDARVVSAGGGLCGTGCPANHPDMQILTPHYLLNADGSPAARPAILDAPASAVYGTSMTVKTDSAITAFSLVRLSSVTHTVNNDQRRLALQFLATGTNRYAVSVPSNPGWAVPGYYMLFAMNAQGVPSVAKIMRIGPGNAPVLAPLADLSATAGTPITSVALGTTNASSHAATGLPPGITLNTVTGVLTGTPSPEGLYNVTVSASNTSGTVSTDFQWRIARPQTVSFVKLEQLTEVNGNPWASMAELNLLDGNGDPLPRAQWKVSADSQEQSNGAGLATNAIDGDPSTFWHTQWLGAVPAPPHSFVVDLGGPKRLTGLRYLPRPGGGNGTIARFRVYVSADGINWGNPVAEGDFRQVNASNSAEKTVPLNVVLPANNRPPVVNTPADQVSNPGQLVTLNIIASDEAELLAYAATGLPPGLAINPTTGVISGKPAAVGNHAVNVMVTDSAGATSTVNFNWRVIDPQSTTPLVTAPILGIGTATAYTVSMPGDTSGLSYAWDFGDGTPETAYAATPANNHLYAAPGVYTVTLLVKAADGQITTHRFNQAIVGATTAGKPAASTSVLVEPASASYGERLWVANPDADTVSVFDAATRAKLGEIAVGKAPRTLTFLGGARRQVWVANRDSASLSVIDAATRAVVKTVAMPHASQPHGIVASPAGDRLFVTLEATGRLLQLDGNGAMVADLYVGPDPRHLSVDSTGAQVLVSRFISPPLPGEGTAAVQTSTNGVHRGGEVLVVNTATMGLRGTVVLRHSEKADSAVQGRGIPNYLGAALIAPDGLSAWVPSKQDNIKRGQLRDGLQLDFQNTVRAVSSRIDLRTLAEVPSARIDFDNAGVASAGVFHPSGAYLFTVLEASRHLVVVDPVGQRELFRVNTGRAPQGVALSTDGRTLFVSNFMDRSIGVYDLSRLLDHGQMNLPLAATLPAVAMEKLPAQVLKGKQFFYDAADPRLARDGYMSCASCHNDGGHDGRTWDMTGRGEGLRNTISLRGRAGAQGLLHWSGNFDEVQDFEAQIRSLAAGTGLMTDADFNAGTRNQPLGNAKKGISTDLDALAAYVASLNTVPPSPHRNPDGTLTAAGVAGRTVFAAQCASCHGGTAFTSSAAGNLKDVGTLKPTSGKRLGAPLTGIDIPTLRAVWATGPFLHDGSAPTLEAAINAHTKLPALSAADLASVSAFVRQIDGTEPAVGATVKSRYVKFEAVSEVNGNAWASMAEFDLLTEAGQLLPRAAWKFSADSEESSGACSTCKAAYAFDGDASTFWHTRWTPSPTLPPHWLVIDLGSQQEFAGFRYRPRPDGGNGTVAQYRFYVSADGVNWGAPVNQGNLANLGARAAVKTVMFGQ